MDKINVLILEDEIIVAETLASDLESLGYNVTDIVDNGPDALASVERQMPDIALLDVQVIGDWDGIETASRIVAHQSIPIIYLTAHADSQTVSRARATHPAAFLVKPYNDRELPIAMELALDEFRKKEDGSSPSTSETTTTHEETPSGLPFQLNDVVFIKAGAGRKKIKLTDILWVDGSNNYVELHTLSGRFVLSHTLKVFLETINLPQLVRIHKSHAVNLDRIDNVSADKVMVGDHPIPIGRTYRDHLMKHLRLL
ncbi:MAG: response regulator [Salibacteraceae bacterium]